MKIKFDKILGIIRESDSLLTVKSDYIFADAAARDVAIPTPTEGQQCVVDGVLQEYQTSAWVDISAVIEGKDGAPGLSKVTVLPAVGSAVLGTVYQIPADTFWALNTAGTAFVEVSKGKADKVAAAVVGNFAALDAAGNLTDSGSKSADFAEASHDHPASEINDATTAGQALITAADAAAQRTALALGTVATLDVPSTGDAATGEVVKGDDTRLTDDRDPNSHTHTASEISDATTAGRALITAADVAAQKTALGVVLDNLTATVAPTVNDDTDLGYAAGSKWLNATTPEMFICLDATADAAVWVSIASGV